MIQSNSYPIKDSNIWIASKQKQEKQEVVFWRVVPKEYRKEKENMESILTKREGMYLIESPIARIYFFITEETEEDLETHLKTLKDL